MREAVSRLPHMIFLEGRTVDLVAQFEAIPDVEPLDGLPDAWQWTRTPTAPSYGSAAALSTDRCQVFQCYAHDSYDRGLARAILQFAREHESDLLAPPQTLLVVAEGFEHPGYQFDTVVSISPMVHRYHLPENPELNEITRSVFPAYRCEFSGTENEDEVFYRYKRAAGAQPTRWNRAPNPYLRMRYRPQVGREIPKRGFTGATSVVREFTRMPERENGFVEFENWQGRVWQVTWHDAYLVTEDQTEVARLDLDGVTAFAKDVLLGPNRAAGESVFVKRY